MKFNIFQKISLLNKINTAWKRCKKIINENKSVAEETRQLAFEQIALFERAKKLFPQAKIVINSLIEIIKNALV
jgi:hypothetical protein